MTLTGDSVMLVTGATGLVGSHVAEQARKKGFRVRAVVRNPSQSAELAAWGVELVAGDMTDRDSLIRAVRGVAVIVHCAAKVGDWGPTEAYRAVNVDGLRHLLEAAEQETQLQRFVHLSSLGVYPAESDRGGGGLSVGAGGVWQNLGLDCAGAVDV